MITFYHVSLCLYVFLLLSVFWYMGDMDLDESVICSILVCVSSFVWSAGVTLCSRVGGLLNMWIDHMCVV